MHVIEFDRVSKAFSHHGGTKLLRNYIKDRFQRRSNELFYALKNVSFRVDRGQSLAVIGPNGAGKSTLLSLVGGLCPPTAGKIRVDGRAVALMELGSGFHPDLTGAENLVLNAALLGQSRKRVSTLFDTIVDFSGIEEFINDPIRTYSSGMVMRLAFSVAVHVDPDILIIDEVLAVGDQNFQAKCFNKIFEFKRAGKTILFVSHAATLVRQLCDVALWLDHGEIVSFGNPTEVLAAYTGQVAASSV